MTGAGPWSNFVDPPLERRMARPGSETSLFVARKHLETDVGQVHTENMTHLFPNGPCFPPCDTTPVDEFQQLRPDQ